MRSSQEGACVQNSQKASNQQSICFKGPRQQESRMLWA